MKYDIIKTDKYLLILGDTFIWEGNEPYFVAEKLVDGRYDVFQIDNVNDWDTSNQFKILAHLPLSANNLKNIPLLPPLEDEVENLGMHDLESYYGSNLELTTSGRMWEEGFDIGYNKAKEKYKYTEEDLRKMFSRAWELRERYKNLDYDKREEFFFQKELKSLSKYPIGFECEMEYDCCGRYQNCKGCDATFDMINVRLKTTSNPQGQTTWMGNYIY
jgi:hypothetical protein